MAAEGVRFETDSDVGKNVDAKEMYDQFDAMLLATGATKPRDLPVPGRELTGVYFAMDFLTANTKTLLDHGTVDTTPIHAKDRDVIVIGGGDTGTDCIGTALRHDCQSLINFELLPEPPAERAADNPWPQWPRIFRVDYGHEESQEKFGADPRSFGILTKSFRGDDRGQVCGIETVDVAWEQQDGKWHMRELPGTGRSWRANLVFLAMGFVGPEHYLSRSLDIKLDRHTNYKATYGKYATNLPGVFSAGDCRRGQSLVVWAIHEGRGAAEAVHSYLQTTADA